METYAERAAQENEDDDDPVVYHRLAREYNPFEFNWFDDEPGAPADVEAHRLLRARQQRAYYRVHKTRATD